LAAFVRHADVYRWLDAEVSGDKNLPSYSPKGKHWLLQFDELVANHYPTLLEAPLPEEAVELYPAAIEVRQRIAGLLSSFEQPRQRLGVWCQAIRAFIATIYPEVRTEQENRSFDNANAGEADAKRIKAAADPGGGVQRG
jgi:hypothetical protein